MKKKNFFKMNLNQLKYVEITPNFIGNNEFDEKFF